MAHTVTNVPYDYLDEKGLVPGKDISVAGYDNRTMSQYLKPALTTVEIIQPVD